MELMIYFHLFTSIVINIQEYEWTGYLMQYLSKVITETINAKNVIDGKEMLLAIVIWTVQG